MSYYILKDGKEWGPYPLKEIEKQYNDKLLSSGTPVRFEASKDYVPLLELMEKQNRTSPVLLLALPVLIVGVGFYAGGGGVGIMLLVALLFSVIFYRVCGTIAKDKGLDYNTFALLGAFTGLIGLIVVLAVPSNK